jgi:hypothetical protein
VRITPDAFDAISRRAHVQCGQSDGRGDPRAKCLKRQLAGIASAKDSPPAARVAAVNSLLDRGWGKAIQPHAGEDGGEIHVVIRQIIDSAEAEPLLIEHETQTPD